MNTKHTVKGLVLATSLVFASVAFAGEKATVKIYENVKVNGKTIAPGTYELAWEGTGANVTVAIRRGNETLTTSSAAVETAKSAPSTTGYSTKKDADCSKEITTVFFAGKKASLNLDQQAAAASAQAASDSGKN